MGKAKTGKTRWHRLMSAMLEEVLRPVGIEVHTEVPVMSCPPEADILLLRRDARFWTPEQLERVPDGIRDSTAGHILLEFKYSESLNAGAFRQAVGYDYFYKQSKGLTDREAQTFLISAKTTEKRTLAKFGYSVSDKKGVYRSRYPLAESVPIISLNELPNEPHNVYIRCFASRRAEKRKSFELLRKKNLTSFSEKFLWFVQGLWNQWFYMGGEEMDCELTPEQAVEIGKMWGEIYLSTLPPEKRMAGLKPEERLVGLKPEERLIGLKPEERLAGLSVREIEDYLSGLKNRKSS
jgi:hypothetical protein